MALTASRSSSNRGRAPSAAAPTVAAALAELLTLGDRRGWVVSCYQKLEPADRAGEKYRIKLKNRLRRAADRLRVLGFPHADRETVAAALDRVASHFQQSSNLAGARGMAVFAADGFFLAVPMPYVLKSRVVVDRTPVVGELVALAEGGSRLLGVVADRRSARFFDVGLEGVEELEGIASPGATRPARFHAARGAAPGVGEYRFHNRIREERQRHLAAVAEAVDACLRVKPYDGVVVGGAGADAEALLPHLSAAARARLLGVLRLPPKRVGAPEVRERSLALLVEAARRAAADAARELDALRGTGLATESVEPTLLALSRGQVRTLLVDGDAEVPGYRCSVGGRLTERPSTGRGEGEPVPLADLLDDAIEDALRQRARVAVVHGADARRFDRLAAVLRFKSGA